MPAEVLRRDPNIGALSGKARRRVSGRRHAGGAALLLLGLAGCGGDNEAQQAALKCPQIEVPAEVGAHYLTRNDSSGNPRDVLVETRITNTYGDCEYTQADVTVDVDVEFTALRGPAAWLEKDFPATYFVAVADSQNRILDKATFTVTVPVPKLGIVPREQIREPLEQVIPLANPRDGASYKILIGFQLTPEQLEVNRRRGVPSLPGGEAAAAGRRTIAPVVPDPRDPPQ